MRVLIAGAGIGGLAAALGLARNGIATAVFERADTFDSAGTGIQLSPNATCVLTGLGLADRLLPFLVAPDAVRLRAARSGREIAVLPLGPAIEKRYGAPYWVMHRADLHKTLLDAAMAESQVALVTGARITGFAVETGGVRVDLVGRGSSAVERGSVLIGADGLWSDVRGTLGDRASPRFTGRTAWRAIVPAEMLGGHFRTPQVNLWLGPGGHLVHYPVRAGKAVNIVAVARDNRHSTSPTRAWSTDADRDEVLAHFGSSAWAREARELLEIPQQWQKWALYDRAPLRHWGSGPVTLVGDAAHPMLPFLAQGAAMAIEDAAVLSGALARAPDESGLRAYEAARQARTARVHRAARRNDRHYHLGRFAAPVRDAVLRVLGGERIIAQYDWLYAWRP
jgi:salicylate hydroxylase